MIDLRCHVVTADLTFRGHVFNLGDDGVARIMDRDRDTVVRALAHATAESRDGEITRVVGTADDGTQAIWRVVKACAKCATVAVYPTPAYDVPT